MDAGELWIGEAMHPRAPVITPDGKPRKVILLSQIDDVTRCVVHSRLRLQARVRDPVASCHRIAVFLSA